MIGQLNPTQLSSRLAAMSDQQLQQYAMLHHDDPFVMAIAMDVKNQRDALRSSTAMPQQQQPTVVQQLISRMAQLPPMQGGAGQQMPPQQLAQPPAPQQAAPAAPAPTATAADGGLMSGIAKLPARNLAKMKAGGIAEYAAGELTVSDPSMVTPDQYFSVPQPDADSDLTETKRAQYASELALGEARKKLQTFGLRQRSKDPEGFAQAKAALAAAERAHAGASEDLDALTNTSDQYAYQNPRKRTAAEQKIFGSLYATPPKAPDMPIPNVRIAGKEGQLPSIAEAEAAARQGAPRPTGARPAAPAPQGGIASLMGPPQPDNVDRLMAGYKPASAQDLIGQAQTIAAPWNKEIEEANKPFKAQFAAERERLQKGEEQNKWQAVMQAGLAMMASRSPYALQALGEGGMRGLQMYQEAQKQDDAARKALMHSEMLMAQAERAERSGNRRDAVQLVQTAEGEKKTALQFGLQAEQIRNTKEYHDGVLAINKLRAATEERKVNLLGQGAADAAKARAEFGKIQLGVMRTLEKDPNYQLADAPTKRKMETERLRAEIMRNPMLAPYASGIGFSAAPAGGKVVADLTPPED